MDIPHMVEWGERKGVNLIGTGDFTHPIYLSELKKELVEDGEGIYKWRGRDSSVRFMFTTEVSNIFHQDGGLRKVHTLILSPSIDDAERIAKKLSKFGELVADGRPTFTFSLKDLVKMVLDLSPRSLLIPAHAWTPWFSIFGSNSGFNSLEEALGEEAKYIHAIETGLSSDPPMNWRVSTLDGITLVSNSDAHSPSRIGRECNVFDCELSYSAIVDAIKNADSRRFLFTIEFFPEEGKYHYDGHRNCGVSLHPRESLKLKNRCPKCGRPLTLGVLHRVEDLADRDEGSTVEGRIPFKHLVPLPEIIGEVLGVEPNAKSVMEKYNSMIHQFGSELEILLDVPYPELERGTLPQIVEGIKRVREGRVKVIPGYDGVYGKVRVFDEEKKSPQMSLF